MLPVAQRLPRNDQSVVPPFISTRWHYNNYSTITAKVQEGAETKASAAQAVSCSL